MRRDLCLAYAFRWGILIWIWDALRSQCGTSVDAAALGFLATLGRKSARYGHAHLRYAAKIRLMASADGHRGLTIRECRGVPPARTDPRPRG
jgi:hypothetical protein